jgi:hypothetical protein
MARLGVIAGAAQINEILLHLLKRGDYARRLLPGVRNGVKGNACAGAGLFAMRQKVTSRGQILYLLRWESEKQMTTLQLTARVEHWCAKCKMTIKVGESMVRSQVWRYGCSSKYAVYEFEHLNCWTEKKGKK